MTNPKKTMNIINDLIACCRGGSCQDCTRFKSGTADINCFDTLKRDAAHELQKFVQPSHIKYPKD